MNKFNATYWESKYQINSTGWDLGQISTPLLTYFETLKNKNIKILIPGGGNGYEAEYLFRSGFKNVFLLDIVAQPLDNFSHRVPQFPKDHLLNIDFFDHNSTYDLIIEQTFFCALDPNLRERYSNKIFELLKDTGRLVGVLFDFPLTDQGPPFGGSLKEYTKTFSKMFDIKKLDRCFNSIPERYGKELFIIFEKKN
ncbi:MAG: TPMT family class I SAM-dependent methyltransferase [Flavobacteriaceae bacterium]|nr:TPMT family class I SAM-dependent methyltransferase [Flavobacteriaceae bacterium]